MLHQSIIQGSIDTSGAIAVGAAVVAGHPALPVANGQAANGQAAGGQRWVYAFGGGGAEGHGGMLAELGGKGAGLAEMARLGVPVPPGFTIVAEASRRHRAGQGGFPAGLSAQVEEALTRLEAVAGARFGGSENPLLVSVRSGARASMPGMMDTILNLGLTDATVKGLVARSGDARFAYDCYRRLIQTYGAVVQGVCAHSFDAALEAYKEGRGLLRDADLGAADWRAVAAAYREVIEREAGEPFPQDARTQLFAAIGAIFRSWSNARAVAFRAVHGIPDDWGTAATVQAMVFGNRGGASGTGVAHSRDPSTGEAVLCGEFLADAQGEDIVSGLRTPGPLSGADASLEAVAPEAFAELGRIAERLERHFGDMQEIEFTVQQGRLFILQSRAGKRTPEAGVRIATEMAQAGIISRDEAVRRADLPALADSLRPIPEPDAPREVIARGLPASSGAATGVLVFTSDEAVRLAAEGVAVVLCRPETSPHDVHGMQVACAVVTARGGATSHAATVARAMGLPCVTGARMLRVDPVAGVMTVGDLTVRSGEIITVDGGAGQVILGSVPMIRPEPPEAVALLLRWAEGVGA
ncbi:pyruvate, phosphate dikinase [Azospirillum formosense]|uniref:Pyruvate, phosphate dikinase n=1 Tax=Azospirillum formosense TaxID=861533 RepID=A0ABX2KWR4_9PROT|nr:PEP/pyruvate-binding domain-containing protein [Azospirillum formosense]MBY3752925.1 pyruvate, phosphate dikinase [Azospirillum formosense]NUB20179.1 pyruvate, phosphate dikinase [Azospirillum formosense]